MKKQTILSGLALSAMIVAMGQSVFSQNKNFKQPALGTRSVKLIEVDGFKFKDLNKNGKLDKYEDWRLANEERSNDLVSKMSLEEKVGFMLISTSRLK